MINNNPYSGNYNPYSPATMKTNGLGRVKADPELAVINLGIITENASLEAAQSENSLKANEVINLLLMLGIPKRNISTLSYNIEPQYDYVEGKQIFRGYKVSNILSVTIEDLSRVGEIIDKVTAAGVNRIGNISFKVEDSSLYYRKALDLAMKDAIEKARLLGNTLGVRVNEIPYKVLEQSSGGIHEEGLMIKFSEAATPILPGQIIITANIEAFFYY